jgi:hypothetical protein
MWIFWLFIFFLAFQFFVAFDDMAGHNFIGRSGIDNFEPMRRIARDDFFKLTMRIVYKNMRLQP